MEVPIELPRQAAETKLEKQSPRLGRLFPQNHRFAGNWSEPLAVRCWLYYINATGGQFWPKLVEIIQNLDDSVLKPLVVCRLKTIPVRVARSKS